MIAFKGFNKDMTCRGFQYKEGEEYTEPKANICKNGFHACKYPLDCFSYYAPNDSEYHLVNLDNENDEIQTHGDDSKICGKHIKIGAKLNIAGLVEASIKYTNKHIDTGKTSDEDYGASSATGVRGASSATGNYGASSATGDCGASSATGYCGASSAESNHSIAVSFGINGKAKGVKGSYIVLADWTIKNGVESPNIYTQDDWDFNGAKMVQIDDVNYKSNTWYTIKNHEIVEWSEENTD